MKSERVSKSSPQKNILITGGNGFIGKHLIKYLNKLNHKIFNLGSKPIENVNFFKLDHKIDIDDIENAISKCRPDFIFHLASSIPTSSFLTSFNVNVMYSIKILEVLERLKLDNFSKVLFVGSAAEYGIVDSKYLPIKETCSTDPFSPYGISKLTTSNLATNWQKNNRHITIARPFTVIGSNMPTHMALGSFFNQIKKSNHKKLEVGNLETQRDFIDVRDLVDIFYKLLNSKSTAGQIYNVCSGRPVSIKEILSYYLKLKKIDIKIEVKKGLLRHNDMPINYGSNKKLNQILGPIKFINWKDSINEIVNKDP